MSDLVLAATDRRLPVDARRIADDRVPDGMIGLGSYLEDRLIARCAVPPEVMEFIETRGLFTKPVQLVLAAREEDPGLQCRLFAVVDVDADALGGGDDDDAPAEPWKASVPKFELEAPPDDAETSEAERQAQGMIFLGQIVRFTKDRRHPDSLPLEAADVLRRLVEGRTSEVVDRVLDDLLGGSEPE
jgi:hypothetical protein